MTQRRPLVIINGQIQELPVGDSTPGVGGGGTKVAKCNVIGNLAVQSGTVRWYPEDNIGLIKMYASLGTAPQNGSAVFNVKKNGTSIGTITVPAGAYVSSDVSLSETATRDDYLTVDTTQANGGANATICLVYQ
jgi:hypothetical protein